jgi:hypothetical protein
MSRKIELPEEFSFADGARARTPADLASRIEAEPPGPWARSADRQVLRKRRLKRFFRVADDLLGTGKTPLQSRTSWPSVQTARAALRDGSHFRPTGTLMRP